VLVPQQALDITSDLFSGPFTSQEG